MIVSVLFGTAFTRLPPHWRFISPTHRNPFPTLFFSFCPFRHRFHTTTAHWRFIGLTDWNPFPTQFFSFCPVKQARTTKWPFSAVSQITKVGCGDSRMNKMTFSFAKMMSIHLLIPYPDISDLLTRGKYLSVKVSAGLPIRDVRLETRSIKPW